MRFTAVLLVTLSGSAFAADPALLNLAMPDAQMIAGVNVTNAKNSPLGQFLISRLPVNGQGMNALKTATGFDPFQDVTEVLAASSAPDATKPGVRPNGLIAMKGTFDADRLVAALGALAKAPSYQVQNYAGATLVTFAAENGKVPAALAFLGGTIAVAGEAPVVTAALDRNSGNNSIDPALAAQVSALSGSEDAWLASSASPASMIPAPPAAQPGQSNSGQSRTTPMDFSQLFANIQSFSAGVKFGDTVPVKLDLVANSDQNAEALANVAKFLVSMVAMNSGQANQDPNAAAALKILQTLTVNVAGTTVDLGLNVPEAQIEALIVAATSAKPAVRPAQPKSN